MDLRNEESSTKWDNEEISTLLPTNIPELEVDEANEVTLIIAYVTGILCVIALIFLMAICVDCRHQKLENSKPTSWQKTTVSRILPKFGWPRRRREDEETIADKMQASETASGRNTATEVV